MTASPADFFGTCRLYPEFVLQGVFLVGRIDISSFLPLPDPALAPPKMIVSTEFRRRKRSAEQKSGKDRELPPEGGGCLLAKRDDLMQGPGFS